VKNRLWTNPVASREKVHRGKPIEGVVELRPDVMLRLVENPLLQCKTPVEESTGRREGPVRWHRAGLGVFY